MAVTATVSVSATGRHTKVVGLGTATLPFTAGVSYSYTDGIAAGMADRVYTDTRTLAASGTENLDLAGVLLDVYGATATFVTIKAVVITAASGNTNEVQVTRPVSNGVPLFMAGGDGISLKPGYGFTWLGSGTGVTVTAATGDLLTITNSAGGTSVTYSIVIIGTSA